jgi:hypothetical protein
MNHRGSRNALSTSLNLAKSTPAPIRRRSPEDKINSIGSPRCWPTAGVSTRAKPTDGIFPFSRFRHA